MEDFWFEKKGSGNGIPASINSDNPLARTAKSDKRRQGQRLKDSVSRE